MESDSTESCDTEWLLLLNVLFFVFTLSPVLCIQGGEGEANWAH